MQVAVDAAELLASHFDISIGLTLALIAGQGDLQGKGKFTLGSRRDGP